MLTDSAALLKFDPVAAKEALQAYRTAKAPSTDEDRQIMTAYREIARGKMVVMAIESIRQAGRFDSGLPKLALARADLRQVHCFAGYEYVQFSKPSRWNSGTTTAYWKVDRMPRANETVAGNATVPLIPLNLRPKFDLKNYHILFEADWVKAPVDPLLLRRLKGDLWLVLAAWELTAVERAVLEQRAQ
jgi:hypothetical protein